MTKKTGCVQYAALPFIVKDGQALVAMITSRETRKWIIPKGRPEKKVAPHDVAAREAFEEAGLVGRIEREPFVTYGSTKRLASGREIPCDVQTFLFRVEEVLDDWPEKRERERRWVTPAEGALLTAESGLVHALLTFASLME